MLNPAGVAFITGAGGAVGRATCLQFARDGLRMIAGLDISETSLEETRKTLSENFPDVKFHPIVLDLTIETDIEKAIKETVATFGRLDYAVNNAAVGQPLLSTSDVDFKEYDKVMNINVRSVFSCAKFELQQMTKQEPLPPIDPFRRESCGSIVNVASIAGLVGLPVLSLYTASKHAIVGLTKADAIDFAKKKIRVNAVCPGFIDTPLNTTSTREHFKDRIASIPAGRLADASEIADSISFLVSERATYITGAMIVADGGYTLL